MSPCRQAILASRRSRQKPALRVEPERAEAAKDPGSFSEDGAGAAIAIVSERGRFDSRDLGGAGRSAAARTNPIIIDLEAGPAHASIESPSH